MTLSAATTPVKSGPESDDVEGVLRIPQCSSITEASPSDCLVSEDLPLYKDAVGVFCSPWRQGHILNGLKTNISGRFLL